MYLPPAPMPLAGVSGFDPQVAFDPGLKRISHALAPPSLVDRYKPTRARDHIKNRGAVEPPADRPLFFDEPDPIPPVALFVQELPRLARDLPPPVRSRLPPPPPPQARPSNVSTPEPYEPPPSQQQIRQKQQPPLKRPDAAQNGAVGCRNLVQVS